jgi:hypothetical protein
MVNVPCGEGLRKIHGTWAVAPLAMYPYSKRPSPLLSPCGTVAAVQLQEVNPVTPPMLVISA